MRWVQPQVQRTQARQRLALTSMTVSLAWPAAYASTNLVCGRSTKINIQKNGKQSASLHACRKPQPTQEYSQVSRKAASSFTGRCSDGTGCSRSGFKPRPDDAVPWPLPDVEGVGCCVGSSSSSSLPPVATKQRVQCWEVLWALKDLLECSDHKARFKNLRLPQKLEVQRGETTRLQDTSA